MQHNAAFHQGLHCLLRSKQISGIEIHYNFENSTCDPLKYTMGSPIPIVSIYMEKFHQKMKLFVSVKKVCCQLQVKVCAGSTG